MAILPDYILYHQGRLTLRLPMMFGVNQKMHFLYITNFLYKGVDMYIMFI